MRSAAVVAGTVLFLAGCASGGPIVVESGPRAGGRALPPAESEVDSSIETSTAATLGIPAGPSPPP